MTTGSGQGHGTNGDAHRRRGTNGARTSLGRRWLSALVVGAGGASALTLSHEIVRQLVPDAPRLDRLGGAALSRVLAGAGVKAPRGERLRGLALVMDLVANAAWYAPVAAPSARPLRRGLLLGLVAGLGAVALPPLLGLPRRARGDTLAGVAMTVGLYTLGGLAAAAVARWRASAPLEV